MQYGNWLALSDPFIKKHKSEKRSFVNCKCLLCGIIKDVRLRDLEDKSSISCGCLNKNNFRHGKSKSKTHNIWLCMKARCFNKKNNRYKNYGARGISVCDSWLIFDNFLDDIGEAPHGMTIERIDNNKDYSKENCCWASYKEQANNKSTNRIINIKGRDYTIAQASDVFKIKYSTLWYRIRKGYDPEKAIL